MALFNFGDKLKENECKMCGGNIAQGDDRACKLRGISTFIESITVLCNDCQCADAQISNIKDALRDMHLDGDVDVNYIIDEKKIKEFTSESIEYPAVAVNKTIISSGKQLSSAEFKELIKK